MKRTLILWCALVAGTCWPASLPAAPPDAHRTVLITPLRLYAAADVAFLNHGILEMLATRLPQQGRIQVKQWNRSPVDEAEAMVLAQEQEADFILLGSVVIFDGNVSTDARLLNAATGEVVLRFSRFGRSPGDVLYHVDLLAREIAAAIDPKASPAKKEG